MSTYRISTEPIGSRSLSRIAAQGIAPARSGSARSATAAASCSATTFEASATALLLPWLSGCFGSHAPESPQAARWLTHRLENFPDRAVRVG